jgi:hypothetical protein
MDGMKQIPKSQWPKTVPPLKTGTIVTIAGLYRKDGKTLQNFVLGKAAKQ